MRAIILALACCTIASSQDYALTKLEPIRKVEDRTETAWRWSQRAAHHRAVVRVRTPWVTGPNGFRRAGAGSGVMISHNGRGTVVLTAAHVVAGNQRVTVISGSNGAEITANVLYQNAQNDLAVLHAPDANPSATVPLANFWPQQGERIEIAGFGGPRSRLRHFVGKFIRRDRLGFEVDTDVISGDSGAPIFCRGCVVGLVRGGERIRGETNGWPLNYPAESDLGGTELCRIVVAVTRRRGLLTRWFDNRQCRPGMNCPPVNTTPPQDDLYPPIGTDPGDSDVDPPAQNQPGEQGPQGPQGEQGPKGDTGQNGISVTGVRVNGNYDLVVTYSDGRQEIAGNVAASIPDRRVLLVDGKTNTVIDDETYGPNDPIVLDAQALIK